MALLHNPYLGADLRSDTKGSEATVEDLCTVQNIRTQTAGGPLDPFEDRLADELMTVFGAGAEEIDDVVAALNAAGSRDQSGAAWNEASFRAQMAASSAALFAVEKRDAQ